MAEAPKTQPLSINDVRRALGFAPHKHSFKYLISDDKYAYFMCRTCGTEAKHGRKALQIMMGLKR